MAQPHFVGFSTADRFKPPYTVVDFDLVKIDLLNHFSTRKGERVMLPEFGTVIYDLLMEPLDDATRQLIIEDGTRIIEQDPRVQIDKSELVDIDNAILLTYELTYLPTGITDEINIQFNIDEQE